MADLSKSNPGPEIEKSSSASDSLLGIVYSSPVNVAPFKGVFITLNTGSHQNDGVLCVNCALLRG